MGFKPIAIDKFVQIYLQNHPSENEKELRERLRSTLEAYQNGVKCSCGNDIWVVGAVSGVTNCFTCITGEAFPRDDYEIDVAVKKCEDKLGRRHIDDMNPSEIHGFFNDDGYEIKTDLVPKPTLCLSCVHNDEPHEELLCNLTRTGQREEKEFICFAYKKF